MPCVRVYTHRMRTKKKRMIENRIIWIGFFYALCRWIEVYKHDPRIGNGIKWNKKGIFPIPLKQFIENHGNCIDYSENSHSMPTMLLAFVILIQGSQITFRVKLIQATCRELELQGITIVRIYNVMLELSLNQSTNCPLFSNNSNFEHVKKFSYLRQIFRVSEFHR